MTVFSRLGMGLAVATLIGFSSAAQARLETPQQAPHLVQMEGANLILTFSAVVNISASTAEITDASNQRIATERLQSGENGLGIKVPLKEPLRPGVYTVKWNALAADGRQSTGSYDFSIGPTPDPAGTVAQN